MSLFCFLWMPLFYLFRRAIYDSDGASGSILALLLGSIVAITEFLIGALVNPGGFGFSRWLSAFVDVVSLPALIPLVVYLVCVVFKFFSGTVDFTNFTLLYLIPVGAIRAVGWSSGNSPVLLILVPLLWTAIAMGIPFFIDLITTWTRWYIVVPCSLGILALPPFAATVYWVFFSQNTGRGFLLLAICLIPAIASIVYTLLRNGR
jgi:hypothetical protein